MQFSALLSILLTIIGFLPSCSSHSHRFFPSVVPILITLLEFLIHFPALLPILITFLGFWVQFSALSPILFIIVGLLPFCGLHCSWIPDAFLYSHPFCLVPALLFSSLFVGSWSFLYSHPFCLLFLSLCPPVLPILITLFGFLVQSPAVSTILITLLEFLMQFLTLLPIMVTVVWFLFSSSLKGSWFQCLTLHPLFSLLLGH